jgi:hypothetical protein
MQIKRVLADKELFAESKVFDAQGRSYTFCRAFWRQASCEFRRQAFGAFYTR